MEQKELTQRMKQQIHQILRMQKERINKRKALSISVMTLNM